MKRVVSFSLWGTQTKYLVGAVRNAELCPRVYPGWVARFYVGKSVPLTISQQLRTLGAEVVLMPGPDDWSGSLWRFEAASDPRVTVMISRDCDSRLNARESAAVAAWLAGSAEFHIMRDHPFHNAPILAGMWGVKAPLLVDMSVLISCYEKSDFWQVDQNFLRDIIYPKVKAVALVHDEFFGGQTFPADRVGLEFVGQVCDENECSPVEHTEALAKSLEARSITSGSLRGFPLPPINRTGWPWTEGSAVVAPASPSRPCPRISIVTPSYNQGQFIEETIRSVLLQGYPNLEYLIVDGGSTDGSREIISKYDSQLTYWVSESDRGQAHAINKGFRRATGEIFAWLNSDDTYVPGAIFEAAEYFQSHPDCQVLYGNCDVVDGEGRLTSHWPNEAFDLNRLLRNNSIAQPATFFRRDGFERVGGLDESLQFCLDYDLWLRIATLGSFAYVQSLWAKFRIHPTSKTSSLETLRCLEIVELLTKWFSRNDIPKCYRKWRAKLIGRAHWLAAVELHRSERKDEAARQILLAILEDPDFVQSRELAAKLVGRLAAQVTTGSLVLVHEFFSLIPEDLPKRSVGFRLAVARAEALIALGGSTNAKCAGAYARQALWRDRRWLGNRHLISRALH